MKFVPASHLVRNAAENGYAVPSFCVWNAETMDTVLRVASDCSAPVILMNGPGEFGLIAPAQMAAIARTVAAGYEVPAALHLAVMPREDLRPVQLLHYGIADLPGHCDVSLKF